MKTKETVEKLKEKYNIDIRLAAELGAELTATIVLDNLKNLQKELNSLKNTYDKILTNLENRLDRLEIEEELKKHWPN